jgi:hypothetical protein
LLPAINPYRSPLSTLTAPRYQPLPLSAYNPYRSALSTITAPRYERLPLPVINHYRFPLSTITAPRYQPFLARTLCHQVSVPWGIENYFSGSSTGGKKIGKHVTSPDSAVE